MKNRKIIITTSTFASIEKAPLNMLNQQHFEIINNPYGRKLTEAEIIDLLPGVIGSIAGLETLNRKVLEKSNLKVISRCGIGIDNIDLEAAKELGIKIFNTPEEPTLAVAEMTIGMMITLPRRIKEMDENLHKGKWKKIIGKQLYGSTVTIIGFGRIGKQVAELLKPFNVRFMIVDPLYNGPNSIESLDEALSEADFITMHASGNSAIIGKKQIDCLKQGVYILNAGRGQLIDESALIEAIDKNIVAGAWIDTFTNEPYEGPLIKYPQVIVTPHVCTYTAQCRYGMEMKAVKNLIKGLEQYG